MVLHRYKYNGNTTRKKNNMRIITATYGGVDVKGIVESKIKGDALVVRSSNSVFGDTSVGHIKYLQIEAQLGGEIYRETIKEGGICVIPKTKNDRLGIFYSNNVNPQTQPTIKRVLKQLERKRLETNAK